MGRRSREPEYQDYLDCFKDDEGRRPRLAEVEFLALDEELLELITWEALRELTPQEMEREILLRYLVAPGGTLYKDLSPAAREEVKRLKSRRRPGTLSAVPPRQAKALFFIRDHIRLHGSSPSEAEIAAYLGVTPPAAHELVVRLARSGRLIRTPGEARSLAIADPEAELEREAKGIVLLAFRNGPIEDVHAGRLCPECAGKPGVSRVTDQEMKGIMKAAVDRVWTLFRMRGEEPAEYERLLQWASLQTRRWDPPETATDF